MPVLFYENKERNRKIGNVKTEWNDKFYFSPNGNDFYRCLQKVRHGFYKDSFDLSFEINRHPELGTVRMKRGDLSINDQEKVSQEEITLIYENGNSETFVHNPELDDSKIKGKRYEYDDREPEYLCKTRAGNFILVDRLVKNWRYETMRCWLGNGKIMGEVKIKPYSFSRSRDGGTTVFETDDHKFFFPTPYEKYKKPTWDGDEIFPCLEEYKVVYNEDMVPSVIEK